MPTTHLRLLVKTKPTELLLPMGLWKILDKPSYLSAHHVEEREVLDHAALGKI